VAAQRRLGWKSNLATLVETPFPRWAWRHPSVAASTLADFYLVRRDPQAAFFSLFRQQHATRLCHQLSNDEDILHLHWLPGVVCPAKFFSRPLKASKIIWSIHDMWPFTGGCHYANGCTQYETTCSDCPQVRPCFQHRVAKAQQQKQTCLDGQNNILAVTPSEWARKRVETSAVMRNLPTEVVANPVDTATFCPLDQAILRRKWGVSPDALVIGVGAADLSDPRKQIPQTLFALRDWISLQSVDSPVEFLIFGKGKPVSQLPASFRFLGPSQNTAMLAEWYNTMDAYISLSQYETFGYTLAEAASCGTPSVCLTGSGMAEVVVDDLTGRHVRSLTELPNTLTELSRQRQHLQTMGLAAREHATRTFDDAVVAARFSALYTRTEELKAV